MQKGIVREDDNEEKGVVCGQDSGVENEKNHQVYPTIQPTYSSDSSRQYTGGVITEIQLATLAEQVSSLERKIETLIFAVQTLKTELQQPQQQHAKNGSYKQ